MRFLPARANDLPRLHTFLFLYLMNFSKYNGNMDTSFRAYQSHSNLSWGFFCRSGQTGLVRQGKETSLPQQFTSSPWLHHRAASVTANSASTPQIYVSGRDVGYYLVRSCPILSPQSWSDPPLGVLLFHFITAEKATSRVFANRAALTIPEGIRKVRNVSAVRHGNFKLYVKFHELYCYKWSKS